VGSNSKNHGRGNGSDLNVFDLPTYDNPPKCLGGYNPMELDIFALRKYEELEQLGISNIRMSRDPNRDCINLEDKVKKLRN